MKKNLVIAHVSPHFDYGGDESRWDRFRPTVALCISGDIKIDVLELRCLQGQQEIAKRVADDIRIKCPNIEVQIGVSDFDENDVNGYNFEEIYHMIYLFFTNFSFKYEEFDYYIYLSPGRGPINAIVNVLLVTYLNIKCKFIHNKVVTKNTLEKNIQTFSAFEAKFSDWLVSIRSLEMDSISSINFLKFNLETINKKYNNLIKQIEHVTMNSTAPILLTGEPGVGKTKLARQIYELKKKVNMISGKYVELNCSTLKGEGLLSMLFGHSKGVYTGAVNAREGLLKSAHNGILFLDEVSEMPISEQAILLKALEEKHFLPFGSDEEVFSNFQIICGTNKNLLEEVSKGNFRYDLLTRIGMWEFALLPLRERREDIPCNIIYELKQYNINTTRSVEFLQDAYKIYIDFALSEEAIWLGNMRSLSSSIERMATFSVVGMITTDIVKDEIARLKKTWQLNNSNEQSEEFPLVKKIIGDAIADLDLFDKFHLEKTLQVCKKAANKSEAGKILYAKSRLQKQRVDDTTRLNSYLKTYNITWNDIKNI